LFINHIHDENCFVRKETYENTELRKLVRLVKSTIFNLRFFTQSSIGSTSRYNVTLLLSISVIFLHFSAIARSSSDNNFHLRWFQG